MGIPAKFILSTTLLLKNRLHTQTHTHTDTSKKTTGTTPKRQKPDHTCLAKVCHMDGPREQISAPTAPCGRVGREIVRRCYNSETKMKPKRSSGLSLVPVLRAPPPLRPNCSNLCTCASLVGQAEAAMLPLAHSILHIHPGHCNVDGNRRGFIDPF